MKKECLVSITAYVSTFTHFLLHTGMRYEPPMKANASGIQHRVEIRSILPVDKIIIFWSTYPASLPGMPLTDKIAYLRPSQSGCHPAVVSQSGRMYGGDGRGGSEVTAPCGRGSPVWERQPRGFCPQPPTGRKKKIILALGKCTDF